MYRDADLIFLQGELTGLAAMQEGSEYATKIKS